MIDEYEYLYKYESSRIWLLAKYIWSWLNMQGDQCLDSIAKIDVSSVSRNESPRHQTFHVA